MTPRCYGGIGIDNNCRMAYYFRKEWNGLIDLKLNVYIVLNIGVRQAKSKDLYF